MAGRLRTLGGLAEMAVPVAADVRYACDAARWLAEPSQIGAWS